MGTLRTLGIEPRTFRLEVEHLRHYTFLPLTVKTSTFGRRRGSKKPGLCPKLGFDSGVRSGTIHQ